MGFVPSANGVLNCELGRILPTLLCSSLIAFIDHLRVRFHFLVFVACKLIFVSRICVNSRCLFLVFIYFWKCCFTVKTDPCAMYAERASGCERDTGTVVFLQDFLSGGGTHHAANRKRHFEFVFCSALECSRLWGHGAG